MYIEKGEMNLVYVTKFISPFSIYIMLFDAFIIKVQNPPCKSQVALLAEPKTPRVYIIL